jgi:hypothetical protein
LKRWLAKFRDSIAEWAPLLGTAAAIGFGVVAVLAYVIACKGITEQRVANEIAYSSVEEARVANDLSRRSLDFAELSAKWSYYSYMAQIAQILLSQIQMCLEHPVSTG